MAEAVDPHFLDKEFLQKMGYIYRYNNEFSEGAKELMEKGVAMLRRMICQEVSRFQDQCCGCPYSASGLKCEDANCSKRLVRVECAVGCGEKCNNKLLTKGLDCNFVTFAAMDGYGECLISKIDIPVKKAIIEYVGRVEFGTVKQHQFFAFPIHMLTGKFKMYINSSIYGNESRLIKQSMQANCEIMEWVVGNQIRLLVSSVREIRKGEVITVAFPQFQT